jgi:hypothetical protein
MKADATHEGGVPMFQCSNVRGVGTWYLGTCAEVAGPPESPCGTVAVTCRNVCCPLPERVLSLPGTGAEVSGTTAVVSRIRCRGRWNRCCRSSARVREEVEHLLLPVGTTAVASWNGGGGGGTSAVAHWNGCSGWAAGVQKRAAPLLRPTERLCTESWLEGGLFENGCLRGRPQRELVPVGGGRPVRRG